MRLPVFLVPGFPQCADQLSSHSLSPLPSSALIPTTMWKHTWNLLLACVLLGVSTDGNTTEVSMNEAQHPKMSHWVFMQDVWRYEFRNSSSFSLWCSWCCCNTSLKAAGRWEHCLDASSSLCFHPAGPSGYQFLSKANECIQGSLDFITWIEMLHPHTVWPHVSS